jgi:catechol 2,3-dioxygenase-like lactoylglutathione lyase family enzyme
MRYRSTILYVPDVPAAVAFYESAFGLERAAAEPCQEYMELRGEGAVLAFAHESMRPAPGAFEIWLADDDVAGALSRALDGGAELVKEPEVKPWGQTVAYVRDPGGVLVELGTPV